MAHMIILIQPAEKKWYIQIGNHDKLETFNLHFKDTENGAKLDGFSIPCLTSYPIFDVLGDSYSKTIAYVTRVMPKICDDAPDVAQFLALLAKKFKVKGYQINVNSDFDWSNLTPWSHYPAIIAITNDLRRVSYTLDF